MKNNKGFISTVAMYSTLLIVLLLIYYIMYFLSMGKNTTNYILSKSKDEIDKIQPQKIEDKDYVLINFSTNDNNSNLDLNKYTIINSQLTDTLKTTFGNYRTYFIDKSEYESHPYNTMIYYIGNMNNNLYMYVDEAGESNNYTMLKYLIGSIDFSDISSYNSASTYIKQRVSIPRSDLSVYKNMMNNNAGTNNSNIISELKYDLKKNNRKICTDNKGSILFSNEPKEFSIKTKTNESTCSEEYYINKDRYNENLNDIYISRDKKNIIFVREKIEWPSNSTSNATNATEFSLLAFDTFNSHSLTLLKEANTDKIPNIEKYNKYYVSYLDIKQNDKYSFSKENISSDYKKIIYINSENSAIRKQISNTLGIDESYVRYVNNINEVKNDLERQIEQDMQSKKSENSNDTYIDSSGANKPELVQGMVPVIYNESSDVWQVADTSTKWYSYGEQMWANAVTVNNATYRSAGAGTQIPMSAIDTMWVWIPRYKYKINGEYSGGTSEQPGEIQINFTKKYQTAHPAFTFGGNELSGFWFAKFETGIGSVTCGDTCTYENIKPLIKPDIYSLVYGITHEYKKTSIYDMFKLTRNMETMDYGFKVENGTFDVDGSYTSNNNNINTHLTKGIEWGAVAYLSQSKYGKKGNSNYTDYNKEIYTNNTGRGKAASPKKYITGRSSGNSEDYDYWNRNTTGTYGYNDKGSCTSTECTGSKTSYKGTGASTTGTIYGIYDMNGGADEYVMSTMYSKLYPDEPIGSNVSGFNGPHPIGLKETYDGRNQCNDGNQYPDSKYYDAYAYRDTKSCDTIDYVVGDAVCETDGWYNNNKTFGSYAPWIVRDKVFGYYTDYGLGDQNQTFRISLVNVD